MKTYHIKFRMVGTGAQGIDVLAQNKFEAFDKAVYELIPAKFGELPYSAWVVSVTYQNGNCHSFNTCEGNPY